MILLYKEWLGIFIIMELYLNSISMLQSDISKSSFILSAIYSPAIHMNIERNFEKGIHCYNNLDQIVGIIIWKINWNHLQISWIYTKWFLVNILKNRPLKKKRCNFNIQTWTLIFLWRKSQTKSRYQLKGYDFIQYFYYFSIWLWSRQHQISRWKGLKKEW